MDAAHGTKRTVDKENPDDVSPSKCIKVAQSVGSASGRQALGSPQGGHKFEVKVLQISDITAKNDKGYYIKETSPYHVHLRVLAIQEKNPIAGTRQKMAVAGVQQDGTVVIVEQWTDVDTFAECERLQAIEHDKYTQGNNIRMLKNNLKFACVPKFTDTSVLLSLQIGNEPAHGGQGISKPTAIVQVLNDFDNEFYKDAICKVKLPPVPTGLMVAIQLNQENVESYKKRFGENDPTTWLDVNGVDEDIVSDNELTEDNFFD
jgi:hypothetical protein